MILKPYKKVSMSTGRLNFRLSDRTANEEMRDNYRFATVHFFIIIYNFTQKLVMISISPIIKFEYIYKIML